MSSENKTIIGKVEEDIETYEEKLAVKVITPSGKDSISYGEVNEGKDSFAAYLRYNRKINKGDEIGILSRSNVAYVPALFGIMKAGALPVPMDPELTKEENAKFIERHELDAVAIPSRDRKLQNKLPDIDLIELNKANQELPVSESQKHKVSKDYNNNTDLSDLGVLTTTSGTTGLPKIAELPHRNFNFVIERASNRMEVGYDDVVSSIAPWHHIMGLTDTLLLSLYNKSSLVYVFPSKELLGDLPTFLEENEISIFLGVPKLFNQLYHRTKERLEEKWSARILKRFKRGRKKLGREVRKKMGATSLRFLACGGAPLSPEVAEFFEKLNIPFVEGYGLTETTGLASLIKPGSVKPGYVGKPMADTDIKIVDPDTLEELEPEEKGEIIIAGDHLMRGYHNEPEETEKVFVKLNGTTYLRTGDWGYLTEDNYLKISGRQKNTIVLSSGKNISPEQVEQELIHSSLIEEILVKQGERKGSQVLKAFVYPNLNELKEMGVIDNKKGLAEEDKDSIRRAIWPAISNNNEKLAPFKQIKSKRDVFIETQPFEKTSTKKIKRDKHETSE